MKPIWQSKTFWANVIGAVLQIVNIEVLPTVDPAILVTIQGVLNIALRFLTAVPVSLTGSK